MAERVAVYPGSFDPPTYGHVDLIERAVRIFDRLIVAVACNDAKDAFFAVEERVEMLQVVTKDLPTVTVTSFRGLTADFARRHNAVALVRGLRVLSDFEFELTMAITNQRLNPAIDTVCLMPSEKHMLLSSRIVREVAQFGGDISDFVCPEVERRLRKRLASADPT